MPLLEKYIMYLNDRAFFVTVVKDLTCTYHNKVTSRDGMGLNIIDCRPTPTNDIDLK